MYKVYKADFLELPVTGQPYGEKPQPVKSKLCDLTRVGPLFAAEPLIWVGPLFAAEPEPNEIDGPAHAHEQAGQG